MKKDKQPKQISTIEWMQAWSSRLLKCNLREFVETDILIITRMSQFMKRKCTGTYQISISISEAIKVRGNVKYVIWGNRGERKSQIPRLISLPVSAPFLVQYAPKILYILMVMFMMGFYPLFCPSSQGGTRRGMMMGFASFPVSSSRHKRAVFFTATFFILSWCFRLTCSNYQTPVWSLYCLALSLTHSVHNVVSKVVQSPNQVEVWQLMFNSLFSLRVKPKVVLALS